MLNKILKYFHERQIQSIIYASVLIITFSAAIGFFIWSLIFLVKIIDFIVISSDEEPTAAPVFDFAGLAALSQKLKIVLPEESAAPAPTLIEPPKVNQPLVEVQTTSTPAEIFIEDISLQILNGTYTKGLAKLWQEKFNAAGFKNIVVENAKTRDYKGAEVSYKSSKANILEKIIEVFTNNGISGGNIVKKEETDELKYDFIVVIGG